MRELDGKMKKLQSVEAIKWNRIWKSVSACVCLANGHIDCARHTIQLMHVIIETISLAVAINLADVFFHIGHNAHTHTFSLRTVKNCFIAHNEKKQHSWKSIIIALLEGST